MTKDLCKSCINTGCEFQSGIVRTKCAFYMPPTSEADLDIDEEIKKFESNAEYERTHENLRGCQEFKKLAEWLKELKELRHEVMDDIKASMIKLPSVTHARPKGHWTREFDDIEGEVRFTCSNCKKYQLFETNFCYHCGSDNGKEEDDEY